MRKGGATVCGIVGKREMEGRRTAFLSNHCDCELQTCMFKG